LGNSQSDDLESYIGLSNLFSRLGNSLVAEKRAQIKRRARREKAKATAERRILSCRVSKKSSQILKECPDIIGKTIENFVQDRNVRA